MGMVDGLAFFFLDFLEWIFFSEMLGFLGRIPNSGFPNASNHRFQIHGAQLYRGECRHLMSNANSTREEPVHPGSFLTLHSPIGPDC